MFQISLGLWEDWEYFQPTVAYDQQVEEYLLRIEITKINGDRVRIESRPDSFMDLTGWLLRVLIDMGSREKFSDEVLQNFLGAMNELSELLRLAPQEAVREPNEG